MPDSPLAPDAPEVAREAVPAGLRTVAGWSWRILVILLLAAALIAVIARLQVLFVALFVALLITSLLQPAADALRRWRVPGALATGGVLMGALGALLGLMFLAIRSVVRQADELTTALLDGFEEVGLWVEGAFGLSLHQLQERATDLLSGLGGAEGESGGGAIASSAFGAASTAVEVLSGAGITLFATIFFVHDGPRIWGWVTSLFPRGARTHVDQAGQLSWSTLSGYARGTVLIAAIDAVGIGVGVWLIGVPLAGTIAVLVFFFSFIPIVGALLSGLVAVLIALATKGLTAALLVLVIVILVQQLEGQILQPVIQGKLVAIHPLAVVLAVAGGTIVAGLVGAVIAVPIVAVANVLVRYTAQASRGQPPDPDHDPAADDPEPVQTPAS
jgi:predicted PurR-regulated permease PerM